MNKSLKLHNFFGKPHNFNYQNIKFSKNFIENNIYKISENLNNTKNNNISNISVIQVRQTHSNKIIKITSENKNSFFDCDGTWTEEKNIALNIFTGDCMAIIFKHKTKNIIGNLHAGWRGVANKIVSEFLKNFTSEINKDFEVYFSPSILECCCEFTNPYTETPDFFHDCVTKKINSENNKIQYFVNLQEIIKKELIENSISPENIYFSDICTKCTNDFWSHRCKETERNASYVVQI